jgi:hypothetical protein
MEIRSEHWVVGLDTQSFKPKSTSLSVNSETLDSQVIEEHCSKLSELGDLEPSFWLTMQFDPYSVSIKRIIPQSEIVGRIQTFSSPSHSMDSSDVNCNECDSLSLPYIYMQTRGHCHRISLRPVSRSETKLAMLFLPGRCLAIWMVPYNTLSFPDIMHFQGLVKHTHR